MRCRIRLVFIPMLAGLSMPGAEPPTLEYLFPAGAAPGGTVEITAGGKFESWPPQTWVYPEGATLEPQADKGKLRLVVEPDAVPGPRWIRLLNEAGVSDPALILIDPVELILEVEPNNKPDQAQVLAELPRVVEGRLEKAGDVDSFAVELRAGQWLVASMDAYRIDSPLDPMLFLYNPAGVQVSFNHDGSSLDSFLVHQALSEGVYVLRVAGFAYPPRADVRLAGEASVVYRLHVHRGPVASHAFPPGLVSGRTNRVEVFGWNFPFEGQPLQLELDPSALGRVGLGLLLADENFENVLAMPVIDGHHVVEATRGEPGEPQALASLPCLAQGRLSESGQRDRYSFRAEKDKSYRIRVRAAVLGFPVDAVVRLEDREGKELARQDDQKDERDPILVWKAPADGEYVTSVSDVFGRGGPNCLYILELAEARLPREAEVTGHTFRIKAGETLEVKVKVTRSKEDPATMRIRADELPVGIEAESVQVPEKGGEVAMVFKASAEAPAAHGRLRFWLVAEEEGRQSEMAVRVPLKGRNAEQGDLALNELPWVWLTVTRDP